MGEKAAFALAGHNPDVLTCIANLSNDEVFTPPEFADEMLDTLADAWAEYHGGASIWANPEVTFLDPCTKSGVFLRQITKRLVDGLAEQIPDLQQRVDHVLTKQVFGIGITQLTALLARRSVYCSKNATGPHSIAHGFDREWGNIWFERTEHDWVQRKTERRAHPLTGDDQRIELEGTGRCRFCGASEAAYARGDVRETHAYDFIHSDDIEVQLAEHFGADMQFDVIIGNPPYQLSDGGFGTSAAPIYDLFIQQAQKLQPRFLTMVVPARWYSGGKGLTEFRAEMLHDRQLVALHDFPDSRDCFPDVDIAGGICYFLWQRGRSGACEITTHLQGRLSTVHRPLLEPGIDIFIRQNQALSILRKIAQVEGSERGTQLALPRNRRFSQQVSARKPFGLPTNFRGHAERDDVHNIAVLRSGGMDWVSEKDIPAGHEYIWRWKVFTAKASHDHGGQPDKDGTRRVLAKTGLVQPGQVTSETYILLGAFDYQESAENCLSYARTRFFRFLLALRSSTQDITKDRFAFVPTQDFSRPWTDADLYAKYSLTNEEIAFIESMIRPMEVEND